MLTQYRILFARDAGAEPRPEWSYCLYAALLDHAPPAFAGEVHGAMTTPISQFLRADENGQLIWTVNLLGSPSEAALSGYLDDVRSVFLNRERVALRVLRKSQRSIPDVETLLSMADGESDSRALHFLTPTAFKSRERYRNLPENRLILQSLIKKWNGCIFDCPIEDEDGHGVEAMAEGLSCRHFQLQDRAYVIKGHEIPGFVGNLSLENHLRGFQRRLADALLLFADFAGVGIKTALGMGGVETS